MIMYIQCCGGKKPFVLVKEISSFNAIFDTRMYLRPPHYFHIKDKLRKIKAVLFAKGKNYPS